MAVLDLDFPTASFPANASIDADCDTTVEAVTTSSTDIHTVEIDNTLNEAAEDVWLHIFNSTSTVTVGTTPPDASFPCRGGKRITYASIDGWTLDTGVQVLCKTAGGTAGTTSPTNNVKVTIVYA